jgi:hypothetical protein
MGLLFDRWERPWANKQTAAAHRKGNKQSSPRTAPSRQRRAAEDVADASVPAAFMALQEIWRVELVPSTYGSRKERRAWDQLMEHITKLAPPEPL